MNCSLAKVKRRQIFCQETKIEISIGMKVMANERRLYSIKKHNFD
jgi:hypothetical protein